MTKVFIKRQNGHIVHVSCDGHTGYGVEGEDIVCAALSSIVQTAVLGLMQFLGLDVKLLRDERHGKLTMDIGILEDKKRAEADIVLETMLLGISDLYEGYSDFIELEVR